MAVHMELKLKPGVINEQSDEVLVSWDTTRNVFEQLVLCMAYLTESAVNRFRGM